MDSIPGQQYYNVVREVLNISNAHEEEGEGDAGTTFSSATESVPVEDKVVEAPEEPNDAKVDSAEGGKKKKVKQGRKEKKVRKEIAKLGLELVPNVKRVTLKRVKTGYFFIDNPEVYFSPTTETYIIFGESRFHDTTQEEKMAAAAQALQAIQQRNKEVNEDPVTDEDYLDAEGLDEMDIKIVVSQAGVNRGQAIRALRKADNDVVDAIMNLSM